VLVAAVVANYHLLTGEQDIRVGTIVANRWRETEGTIGHFVNTVILRVKVAPEATFKDLINGVRTATIVAFSQREFPMEQLMRELEAEQDFDRASLFRVLINYQKHDSKPMNVTGLTFASWNVPYTEPEEEPLPTAFDLIFNFKETATRLTGTMNVRCALSLVTNFSQIIELMVSDPSLSLSKLSRTIKPESKSGEGPLWEDL
jgi:hypothetical protein